MGFYDDFYSNFRMWNYTVDKLCTLKEQRWLIENFFYKCHGYFPNLDHPRSFTEKIQWLKLHYRNPEILSCIDKYRVKEYVADKIGKEHVIPLLGVWDHVNDIDFDALPSQFVLKVNWRDGGSAHVVKDKSKLNIDRIKFILNNEMQPWASASYYAHFWGYKEIQPKIIAEKYIEQVDGQLYDYKFYCFNGVPKLIYVAKDNNLPGVPFKMVFYDMNWLKLDIGYGNHEILDSMEKPRLFDKMVEFATILSKPFPFVRVDFYSTGNDVFLGEMTFHPGDGTVPYKPVERDFELGAMLDIDALVSSPPPNISNVR